MGDLVKRIRQLRNGRNISNYYSFSKPVSLSSEREIARNKWVYTPGGKIDAFNYYHRDRIHAAAAGGASFIFETKRPVFYHVHYSQKSSQNKYCSKGGPPPRSSGEKAKFKLVSFILTTSFALIGAFLYNLWKIKVRYSTLLPHNADLLPLPGSSNYVYICDPLAEAGFWQTQMFPWLPQIHDPKYETAWRLAQDTSSSDPQKRRNAIAILSSMILEDTQCQQIAQMINFEAAVGLAHSNADPRLVARHRSINLKCPHINLGAKFREILDNMPKDSVHQCVIDYSSAALRSFMPSEQDIEVLSFDTLTGFESEPVVGAKIKRKLREEQFLIPCLQAVLSHSRVLDNVSLLLQYRILDVLMTVVEKYRCNRDIMYLVVKIIANLTCDPNISVYMKETGCLRLLAELAESLDLKLSMPARRALHNLDREYSTPLLPSGIYQLYPDFRFDESELDIDIVFVHGLLGGAFRTWRREDKKAVLRVSTKPGEPKKPSKIRAWLDGFTPVNKGSEPPEMIADINNNNTNKSNNGNSSDNIHACREWKDGQWIVNHECNDVEIESKSSGASQCWPRDWLPKDIEGARILAVDFDSFITHWTKVCPVENVGRTLFDRSTELLEKLSSAGIGQRPIVWVTHSMGGLLVKHLLTQSAKSKESNINAVAKQTRGIMFCSVPHVGSNIASKTSVGAALLFMPTQEVKELSYGSEELKKLNESFKRIRAERKYKVISFGEARDVTVSSIMVKKLSVQLVPLSSADPGYGDFYTLDVDHLNICKVRSRGAFVYQKLVELVDNVRAKTKDFDDGEGTPAPVLFPDAGNGNKNRKKKIFEPDKTDQKKRG